MQFFVTGAYSVTDANIDFYDQEALLGMGGVAFAGKPSNRTSLQGTIQGSVQVTMTSKGIAISTVGGDAPGSNAVVRGDRALGLEPGLGVRGDSGRYNGLLAPEDCPEGGLITLDRTSVRGLTHLGAPSSAPPTAATRSGSR